MRKQKKIRRNRESGVPFFLYFSIFSCFSKARKAVKRTSEIKFSYTELASN